MYGIDYGSLTLLRHTRLYAHSDRLLVIIILGAYLVSYAYAWAKLYVTIPVCVVEDAGLVACMRRSLYLTTGNVWKLFGLILIERLFFFFMREAIEFFTTSRFMNTLLYYALDPLPESFFCIMLAIAYHDLRATKEGVAKEHMVEVFS